MKIATIATPRGPEIALVRGNEHLLLSDSIPASPTDMTELIARWDEWKGLVQRADQDATTWRTHDPADLLAPVPRPGRILAIGLNYIDHIDEMGHPRPEHQVWFSKQSGVHPPFAPVQIPRVSQDVDHEVELVAIIGKGGRHIRAEDAPAHVFGYCVGNDVSVRDWQFRTHQWDLGKSFDTHGPFGPWITTSDEVADPHGRDIRCSVNDVVVQQSNTGLLCFDIWQQIAYLSQAMTLAPGDLIFTGTPGGVGASYDPPRYLKAGDTVRCEIDGLGWIENRFVAEP
jgi:2-keto-4-pentenoate hydratase/2-oxohepta-3-ene-1,7-dioic acid hydratase in catechol pathway